MILDKGTIVANRYKVHLAIGSGSFGSVYRVHDLTNKDWKAMKVVKKMEAINGSYIGERRMLEELRGVRGVPVLHDFYENGPYEYLILDLYIGDLETLRLKPLKPKTVMKVAIEITKILKDIHGRGFLHRDLKSANCMIPYNQRNEKLILIDYNVGIKFGVPKNPRTQSLRRLPIPTRDFAFHKCIYSALRAGEGTGCQETEDLEQLIYLLMETRDIFPFSGTAEEFAQQKKDFRQEPASFLTQSNIFLYPVIDVILKQEFGVRPDYRKILKVMRQNGYIINEKAPFEVKTSSTGKPYIE
ncbi:hypothetical protein CAEBREN_10079 [Caenorhabditis brenneri]|uniref:non-specific serine/threonine protein kinase n=1 Tax=Caenorhabditis brenneri TaxID=135651 RepID=G0P1G5_CAEBE|nr:hypothetical protein CAEBREN_10079 [Caenorhabditis brenneri]